MQKAGIFLLFFILTKSLIALEPVKEKDTTVNKHVVNKLDTTCIGSYRKFLSTKLVISTRYNNFSFTDDTTGAALNYKINSKTSIGIGIGYKGIGVELSITPKRIFGNNKDDALYGKTSQFALSTGSNGRRFIYNVYLRLNSGFSTPLLYKNNNGKDTAVNLIRPDIVNINLGAEMVYLFNNKRFSSSAPYNFTQCQKRSSGSWMVGGLFNIYTVGGDSLIFPDSLKDKFSAEARFSSAGSIALGISGGYTHTFVLGKRKRWFINFYLLPGIARQRFFAVNASTNEATTRVTVGVPLQYRFSVGYNKGPFFMGVSTLGTSYNINTESRANFSFGYGSTRFYCGYRFSLKREYFTKYLK